MLQQQVVMLGAAEKFWLPLVFGHLVVLPKQAEAWLVGYWEQQHLVQIGALKAQQ